MVRRFMSWKDSAEPGTPDVEVALREIYVLYTDYALKNPFYELEMPIRCDLFVQSVDALIDRLERNSITSGGGAMGLNIVKK
jgi:hypothetical protein